MSNQYAVQNPNDRNGNSMTGFPVPGAKPAIASYANENAGTSSLIALTDNTTVIEVAAQGVTGAGIKWYGTGAGNASVITAVVGANYDHFIPAGQVRRFVVPPSVIGTSSIVGLNKQAGLYSHVAIKSSGIASVMTTEY